MVKVMMSRSVMAIALENINVLQKTNVEILSARSPSTNYQATKIIVDHVVIRQN